jgi:hypothetical protein
MTVGRRSEEAEDDGAAIDGGAASRSAARAPWGRPTAAFWSNERRRRRERSSDSIAAFATSIRATNRPDEVTRSISPLTLWSWNAPFARLAQVDQVLELAGLAEQPVDVVDDGQVHRFVDPGVPASMVQPSLGAVGDEH